MAQPLKGEREENQEEVLAAAQPDKVVRGVNGSLTPKARKLRPLAGIILIALVVLAAAYMRHGLANRHKKTVKQTDTQKVGAGPATTVPIAVFLSLVMAAPSVRAATDAHPVQPNAPRTVIVSEATTPPEIRAGLLQSTLIVLPAEEKVANVFAGDTVNWIFDGGHVASRFISVKPKTADAATDKGATESLQ